MSDEKTEGLENPVFVRSTHVAEFLMWLRDEDELIVEPEKARDLGIEYFEHLAAIGTIPEDWHDDIHVVLEDWA